MVFEIVSDNGPRKSEEDIEFHQGKGYPVWTDEMMTFGHKQSPSPPCR